MKRVTKAVFAALALAGAATALSAPAKAAGGVYFGSSGGDPYYGGSYSSDPYADPYSIPYADPYADPYYSDPSYGYGYQDSYSDPYACDYYNPPWGYPPDYCSYQTWNQPVYYGGLWYSGPVYYRNYGGANLFWLNGGWRRDEWRGARPGSIDWGRNMRWNGPVQHRGDFANRGGSYGGSYGSRGGNYGNSYSGNFGNRNGGNFSGRTFGGQNFVAPQNGGAQAGGGFQGGTRFGGRPGGGPGFVAPQKGAGQPAGTSKAARAQCAETVGPPGRSIRQPFRWRQFRRPEWRREAGLRRPQCRPRQQPRGRWKEQGLPGPRRRRL